MMDVVSRRTEALLVLSFLKGVGRKTLQEAGRRLRDSQLSRQEAATLHPAISRALEDPEAWGLAVERAASQLELAEKSEARILSPFDEEYPPLLAAVEDRPELLFVRGELGPGRTRSISVIGTREPTRFGLKSAQRLTEYFVSHGWSIVSGLAYGVDVASHKAALDCAGHTVAVLAHGLDRTYPKAHEPIAQEIVERGGALVSEYPFGTPPMGARFVQRDRIQAALSQAVVLVQTDMKGGSLHASRAVLKYGRVLAYPLPSREDVARGEAKIQGVLFIHQKSPAEVAKFLEVDSLAVERRVRALRGPEDVHELLTCLEASGDTLRAELSQESLF